MSQFKISVLRVNGTTRNGHVYTHRALEQIVMKSSFPMYATFFSSALEKLDIGLSKISALQIHKLELIDDELVATVSIMDNAVGSILKKTISAGNNPQLGISVRATRESGSIVDIHTVFGGIIDMRNKKL